MLIQRKCLINIILKNRRESHNKGRTPTLFLLQLFFLTDVHEVNNLNSMQLYLAIKFIVHSLPSFCVSENILSLEWNTESMRFL